MNEMMAIDGGGLTDTILQAGGKTITNAYSKPVTYTRRDKWGRVSATRPASNFMACVGRAMSGDW